MKELIKEIVDNGVEVTIRKKDDGVYVYDVHTGAKSGLELEHVIDDRWRAYMRYGEIETLYNPGLYDIALLVKHCMHGRDYVSTYWADIMEKDGIIRRIIETKVTYK